MAPALITFESPELYRLHNAAGFWGPVTSSVDWCEHNYAVSYYVAEFFNCFSNLAIVAAGLLGLSFLNSFAGGVEFVWGGAPRAPAAGAWGVSSLLW